MVDFIKMMTLEELKEDARQKLAPYYSSEQIENIVEQYVSVVCFKHANIGCAIPENGGEEFREIRKAKESESYEKAIVCLI